MSTVELVATLIPLSLITVIIFFGNGLVILAFLTQPSLRTAPNAYLVSLAFVDLSVGIFVLPLNIHYNIMEQKWIFGDVLCKLWLTIDVTLCTLSIFHLIAIGVDRYRAITDGINYVQKRSVVAVAWTVLGLWILALWISTPPVLGWNDWNEGTENSIFKKQLCILTTNKGYVIHSALGCFIIPMVLMVVTYGKIYFAIKTRLRERARVPTAERSHLSYCSSDDILNEKAIMNEGRKISKSSTLPSSQIKAFVDKKLKFSLTRERRAAKTLGIIIGAFVVCWLPFCCMYVITSWLPDKWQPNEKVFQAFTWLGYVNSAMNPIIYTIFNPEFRQAFKTILHIS